MKVCTCDVVVGSTLIATDPDELWFGAPFTVTTAEMFTIVCVFTVAVLMVNMLEVAPPAIMMVGFGSVTTCGLSTESVAVKPTEGAAGEKVTVMTAV